MTPDPKCARCKGTGMIELLTSSCKCDCVKKSLDQDKAECREAIIALEQAIHDGLYKVCVGCNQAKDGKSCVLCGRWVCGQCRFDKRCYRCCHKPIPRSRPT
jgi:hypothetical protein